jgi:hypothetical protein
VISGGTDIVEKIGFRNEGRNGGEENRFATIPRTAIKALMSPSEFLKEMPKTGGFVEPLVFMIAMGVVAGLLESILSVLRFQVGAGLPAFPDLGSLSFPIMSNASHIPLREGWWLHG